MKQPRRLIITCLDTIDEVLSVLGFKCMTCLSCEFLFSNLFLSFRATASDQEGLRH